MPPGQDLIFDADDTLWENNVYFEQAFDDFVAFLDHSTLSGVEVRAVLDEIETVNRTIHGYGARNFGLNLGECYQRLCERRIGAGDLDRVMALAERILDQPLELISGVRETLEELATRNRLLLFTKGHPEEQKMKIERSGLETFFRHTAIVREKDAASYRELVATAGLDPARAWMIGNSPRSDINPALEIGLGAVHVPHPRTWSLETEEIRPANGRLLVLDRFSALRDHF
jgi:putative hydrolase of the HAD superfamily